MNRRDFIQRFFFTSVGAMVVSASTCSKAGPKDPLWGKDVCAHCRMTLVERDFAAQRVGPGYRWQFYDDLGCALAADGSEANGELYVRIKGSDKWAPAESARYDKGFKTPMNSGFGAVPGGKYSLADVRKLLSDAAHGGHHQ